MLNPRIEKKANDVCCHINILEKWMSTTEDDESVPAQLISTQYLVIAAYGIIESAMKLMILDYIDNNSKPYVASALKKTVSRQYSWNFKRIRDNLAEFDKSWSEQETDKLSDQEKHSITSLKNARDKIAHGASNEATFQDAKLQFKHAVKGLYTISNIIKP